MAAIPEGTSRPILNLTHRETPPAAILLVTAYGKRKSMTKTNWLKQAVEADGGFGVDTDCHTVFSIGGHSAAPRLAEEP